MWRVIRDPALAVLAFQHNHAISLWSALCTLDHIEFNVGALIQRLVSVTLDGAEVTEHIRSILACEKAESLCVVEPCDLPVCCAMMLSLRSVYCTIDLNKLARLFHLRQGGESPPAAIYSPVWDLTNITNRPLSSQRKLVPLLA